MLTLLVISAVDGNGNNLSLAWAIIDRENEENWSWFLSGVMLFLPDFLKSVVISDR